jgi:hypothetical protein
MSLTYTSYLASIANLMPVPTTDPDFQTMVPNMIDDAEQRLYRTLDLLDTSVRDSSAALTSGSRNFNLPSTLGTFIVTDEVHAITPAGTSNPDAGTRHQLVPSSEEMLNAMWPSVTGSSVPQYFAMVNQNLIIVGPWPDQAYQMEIVGTIRPAPLSVSNTTTLLSVFFPDLMVAASMVFAAAYMKNFGAAVDDPKAGVTWEGHFQELLKSAAVEEQRKKFSTEGWSDKGPSMAGTPRV